jgi:peroxiredoxin
VRKLRNLLLFLTFCTGTYLLLQASLWWHIPPPEEPTMPAPYAAKLAEQRELLPPNQGEPLFDPQAYRGRVVVVCASSATSAETERWLTELARTWKEGLPQGVEMVWLGVGSGAEEVAEVVRRLQLPFPAKPDPAGSGADRLNHRIDPSLYIIGKWGEVRYAGELPGPRLGRMMDMLVKETEGGERQFFTSRGADRGNLAAEFSLVDLEGRPVSLRSLLESAAAVCLVFAGSDLTSGVAATRELARLSDAFPGGELRVVLIYSSVTLPKVREASRGTGQVTILVDESGAVARTYLVEEPPLLLLIGVRGIIRYRGSSLTDVTNLARGLASRVRPPPSTGRDLLPP